MMEFHVAQAMKIDPREDKLPAWAREKLKDMRRATAEATGELEALKTGTKPSPFWLESWESHQRYYLPEGAGRLKFKSGDGELTLYSGRNGHDPSYLTICGAPHGVIVAPYSTNMLLVRNQT